MKDKEKIRNSIISAAAGLFEKYGYEKTSVDEIAAAAHKAKASVYYHFDSKLGIFKSVLQQEMADIIRRMTEVIDAHPEQKEQLIAYMKARIDVIGYAKVFYSYIMAPYLEKSGEVKEAVEEARNILDDWEYAYFVTACNNGREAGILSEAVEPDAFGKTMLVILRGLELQFKSYEDRKALRKTYDAMVDLLISRNFSNSNE